jgi:hypothetical protein
MATEAKPKRVDIGFQGGQVLSVRVSADAHEALRAALGGERAGRWFELQTQDSDIAIDLSQVVYVRIDTEEQRVGF